MRTVIYPGGFDPPMDVPIRPPGYFAECYLDAEDAAFEERICRDSLDTSGND